MKEFLDASTSIISQVGTKMLNHTVQVVESQPSDIALLNIGIWEGTAIALGIIFIACIGLIVRGLFIYYLNYEAPGDRPINMMMLQNEVS